MADTVGNVYLALGGTIKTMECFRAIANVTCQFQARVGLALTDKRLLEAAVQNESADAYWLRGECKAMSRQQFDRISTDLRALHPITDDWGDGWFFLRMHKVAGVIAVKLPGRDRMLFVHHQGAIHLSVADAQDAGRLRDAMRADQFMREIGVIDTEPRRMESNKAAPRFRMSDDVKFCVRAGI